MANETQIGSTVPDGGGKVIFKRVVERVSIVFYALLRIRFIVTLLAVALVEALLAPVWPRLAIFSLATAAVSIGLILANCSLLVSELSMRAQQIHSGIVSLHDEELQKLAQGQRRAAPVAPPSSRLN
jgi:hypothetical protein